MCALLALLGWLACLWMETLSCAFSLVGFCFSLVGFYFSLLQGFLTSLGSWGCSYLGGCCLCFLW